MRIFEIQPQGPRTPEQAKIDQLKTNSKKASQALSMERNRQKVQKAQKAMQKLQAPKLAKHKLTSPKLTA